MWRAEHRNCKTGRCRRILCCIGTVRLGKQASVSNSAGSFFSAQAFRPLGTFATRTSFIDKRKDLGIMNEQSGDESQRGLYVSSAYGQVKKSRASANHFKPLMSQLNLQGENEVPGSVMFAPNTFEENMDKRDARELCRRWRAKGAPPAYLASLAMQHLWATRRSFKNNSIDNYVTTIHLQGDERGNRRQCECQGILRGNVQQTPNHHASIKKG